MIAFLTTHLLDGFYLQHRGRLYNLERKVLANYLRALWSESDWRPSQVFELVHLMKICMYMLVRLSLYMIRFVGFSIRQYSLTVHDDLLAEKCYKGEIARLGSFGNQKP